MRPQSCSRCRRGSQARAARSTEGELMGLGRHLCLTRIRGRDPAASISSDRSQHDLAGGRSEPRLAHLQSAALGNPRRIMITGASAIHGVILELTRYPAGAVSSSHNDMAAAEFALPGRLSAVALEPLRTRTAHVVQFRSIAAIHQGARNGAENSQEIHPRTPHTVPQAPIF